MWRLAPFTMCVMACAPDPASRSSNDARLQVQSVLAATADTTSTSVFLLDLRYSNGSGGICSATLVSPRVLLTAGHCLDPSLEGAGSMTVKATNKADDSNLKSTDFIDVTKQARHPQYGGEGAHDLGLLLLASVPSGVTPRSVLRAPPSPWAGQSLRLVGYGRTAVSANDSGTRRSATITVSSASADLVEFGSAGASGICLGDSGGPGLLTVSGTEYVAGVHSYGTSSQCGVGADVRVDTNLSFIDAFVTTNDPPLCTSDGRCATGCVPADPDCPTCDVADGVCDPACLNDPDCVTPSCAVADSKCPADCPSDPDCLGDGDVCHAATDCATRECLADPRGYSFCSRACTTSSQCQRAMVCVDSLCRVPSTTIRSGDDTPVHGGCDTSGGSVNGAWWLVVLVFSERWAKAKARAAGVRPRSTRSGTRL